MASPGANSAHWTLRNVNRELVRLWACCIAQVMVSNLLLYHCKIWLLWSLRNAEYPIRPRRVAGAPSHMGRLGWTPFTLNA